MRPRTQAFICLSAAAAVAPIAIAEVTVSFDTGELVASGLSPHGEVAVIGVARERRPHHTKVVHHRELLTADVDGMVRYAVGDTVPERSVWGVADVATGEVELSAPAAFGVRSSERLRPEIPLGLDGGRGRLRLARESVEVLLIRPQEGVWHLSARDGGSVDQDAAHGSVELAVPTLGSLVSGLAAPQQAQPGDVIVVISPDRMEAFEVRLDAAFLGN